jgi:hypothetical protein
MYHPRFKGNHYDIGPKFGNILRKKNIDFIYSNFGFCHIVRLEVQGFLGH